MLPQRNNIPTKSTHQHPGYYLGNGWGISLAINALFSFFEAILGALDWPGTLRSSHHLSAGTKVWNARSQTQGFIHARQTLSTMYPALNSVFDWQFTSLKQYLLIPTVN